MQDQVDGYKFDALWRLVEGKGGDSENGIIHNIIRKRDDSEARGREMHFE